MRRQDETGLCRQVGEYALFAGARVASPQRPEWLSWLQVETSFITIDYPLEQENMTSRLFDLTGRAALVTGGSRGLGKAMATIFAEAGAEVVISSRHEQELQAAAAEIRAKTAARVEYLAAWAHSPGPSRRP